VPADPAAVKVKVVPLGVLATVQAAFIEVPAAPVSPSSAMTEPVTMLCAETVVTVTVVETRIAETTAGQSTQS
jgi:hypothetical protein